MAFSIDNKPLTHVKNIKLFIIKFPYPRNERVQKLIFLVILVYILFLLVYSTGPPSFALSFLESTPISYSISSSNYKFNPKNELKRLLAQKNSYEFSWNQWVDLSDFFIKRKPISFKFSKHMEGHYNAPPQNVSGSPNDFRTIGQFYLANYAEAPNKIIYLGKDQTKTFVISQKQNNESTNSTTVSDIYRVIERDNLLSPYTSLIFPSTPLEDKLFLFNDSASFHLFNVDFTNLDTIYKTRNNKSNTNEEELSGQEIEELHHSKFVSTVLSTIDTTPKFFHELWLTSTPYLGIHYDWRFFRQVRQGKDLTHTLHHLVRTWSDFTMREGIISWLAHGSLLGWYWNGLNMPWDPDVDIQMPIAELNRLTRRYNNTLIIQNPKEGDGRYLLEVTPAYVQRVRGNGNNNIDARFIDIRSGMYLDITGLTYNNPTEPETIGCKAPHWYDQHYIFPLRLTTFEGASMYIPNNIHKVLIDEYKNYEKPEYENQFFSQDLRLWVSKEVCEGFTKEKLKYTDNTDSAKLTRYGACDNDTIFELYQNTKELTKLRYQEQQYIENNIESQPNDGLPVIELIAKNSKNFVKFVKRHPPIHPSPRYIPI